MLRKKKCCCDGPDDPEVNDYTVFVPCGTDDGFATFPATIYAPGRYPLNKLFTSDASGAQRCYRSTQHISGLLSPPANTVGPEDIIATDYERVVDIDPSRIRVTLDGIEPSAANCCWKQPLPVFSGEFFKVSNTAQANGTFPVTAFGGGDICWQGYWTNYALSVDYNRWPSNFVTGCSGSPTGSGTGTGYVSLRLLNAFDTCEPWLQEVNEASGFAATIILNAGFTGAQGNVATRSAIGQAHPITWMANSLTKIASGCTDTSIVVGGTLRVDIDPA